MALDLVHYVMDGMAVSFLTHEHGDQEKRLLDYLEGTAARAGAAEGEPERPESARNSSRGTIEPRRLACRRPLRSTFATELRH